jgi:hypothetical protein
MDKKQRLVKVIEKFQHWNKKNFLISALVNGDKHVNI